MWYFLSNTFKAREAIKIKGVVIGELWGDRNAPSPMINRIFSADFHAFFKELRRKTSAMT